MKKVYSVWVGGIEINNYFLNKKEAKLLLLEYKEKGYNDVQIIKNK